MCDEQRSRRPAGNEGPPLAPLDQMPVVCTDASDVCRLRANLNHRRANELEEEFGYWRRGRAVPGRRQCRGRYNLGDNGKVYLTEFGNTAEVPATPELLDAIAKAGGGIISLPHDPAMIMSSGGGSHGVWSRA